MLITICNFGSSIELLSWNLSNIYLRVLLAGLLLCTRISAVCIYLFVIWIIHKDKYLSKHKQNINKYFYGLARHVDAPTPAPPKPKPEPMKTELLPKPKPEPVKTELLPKPKPEPVKTELLVQPERWFTHGVSSSTLPSFSADVYRFSPGRFYSTFGFPISHQHS